MQQCFANFGQAMQSMRTKHDQKLSLFEAFGKPRQCLVLFAKFLV
jgi:hypothetical protein